MPVLAIAAQLPSAEIGRNYFQETHPQNLFGECSRCCEMVSTPEQMPGVLETATRTAVGKRGVSVLVLPAPAVVRPADAELDQLAALLNGSAKVTLLCGCGCYGAHAPLMRLAEALKSPIVHALGGKGSVEHDNPHGVGMTGLIGFSSGCAATMGCDTLLMLGTDFPYPQFYPANATVAQVDLRA